MRMHNRLSTWVMIGTVGLALAGGVATAQEHGAANQPGHGAPPAAAAAAGAHAPEDVTTVTYNVSDLVRTAPDYPFESGAALPMKVNALQGGGGGGGGYNQPMFGSGGGGGEGGGQQQQGKAGITIDSLKSVLMDTVAPDTWRDKGGTIGSAQQLGSLLVVTQTQQNQQQVTNLLNMIRKEYGPLQTVGVRARWLLLDEGQTRQLTGSSKSAVSAIDDALVQQLPPDAMWAAGRTSCFSGQTVYVASGRSRTVVTGVSPVVGQQAVAYQMDTSMLQSGAILQVTPLLSPDGKTAVLDLASVATDLGGAEGTIEVASFDSGGAQNVATTRPSGGIDRLNIGVQHMRTTVKVPVGKPVLVGGMTREPGRSGGKQLYLVAEVTAGD